MQSLTLAGEGHRITTLSSVWGEHVQRDDNSLEMLAEFSPLVTAPSLSQSKSSSLSIGYFPGENKKKIKKLTRDPLGPRAKSTWRSCCFS